MPDLDSQTKNMACVARSQLQIIPNSAITQGSPVAPKREPSNCLYVILSAQMELKQIKLQHSNQF